MKLCHRSLLSFVIGFAAFFAFAPNYLIPGQNSVAIGAFWSGGLLNPPGYPFFSIFAAIFKWLPISSIALRANFAAALCGGTVLCLMAENLNILYRILTKSEMSSKIYIFGLLLLVALVWAPLGMIIFSHLEKHSISMCILFGFTLYLLFLHDKKEITTSKGFWAGLLSVSCILANYSYGAPALLSLGIFYFYNKKFLGIPFFKYFLVGAFASLGFILALPLTSLSSPILDWNNPQTFAHLKYIFTRGQYQANPIELTMDYFFNQCLLRYSLLRDQLASPWLLALLVTLSIYFLLKAKKFRLLIIGLLFLITTGELVSAFVRFYSSTGGTSELQLGLARMMWPNYSAWYLFLALGLTTVITVYSPKSKNLNLLFNIGIIFILLTQGYTNFNRGVDPAILPELRQNLSEVLQPGTLIITPVDSVYFDLITAQAEGKFPNYPIIHAHFFETFWYWKTLIRLYPEFFSKWHQELKSHAQELEKFTLTDIEEKRSILFSQNLAEENKILLNKIMESAKSVFLIEDSHITPINAYQFTPWQQEPGAIGAWLFKGESEPHSIPWKKFSFNEVSKNNVTDFPWQAAYKYFYQEKLQSRIPMEKVFFPENMQFLERGTAFKTGAR